MKEKSIDRYSLKGHKTIRRSPELYQKQYEVFLKAPCLKVIRHKKEEIRKTESLVQSFSAEGRKEGMQVLVNYFRKDLDSIGVSLRGMLSAARLCREWRHSVSKINR